MGFSIASQDDGHILIVTIDEQYDMVNEIVELSRQVVACLDKGPEGTITIIDARAVQIKDLNSLLLSAQNMSRPEVKASRMHPKLLKSYSIITNRYVTAAMKGMNTATFGFVQTTLFESVEAAVAQAHSEIAAYLAN
jgi:hypothetical protein